MPYRTIPIKPSSNILQIQYDEEAKDLLVIFVRQGRRYLFHGVDSRVAESASQAESVGIWFRQEIKDQFPYEEI